jgi:hypothetical protein
MIKERLQEFKPANKEQAQSALREIMQEIALAGLYRGNFFEQAAFYGGTALRIFHGLDRYSEDLDFSLLKQNEDFSLEKYLDAIKTEFSSFGMEVSIKEKKKAKDTHVDSAFLKSETIWRELVLDSVIPQAGLDQTPSLKIKIEVDTVPPMGFATEDKLLLKPFSFYVRCFTLPYLFAGKMHALLYRKWGQNVKGRDWYDFEWYVKKGVPLNLKHFQQRAVASGDIPEKTLIAQEFITILKNRIDTVDMNLVKQDIIRFIPNPAAIDIWSPTYFKDLAAHLKFE